MLGDDDDVFDSVTWESPAAPTGYGAAGGPSALSGPGFRQSTSEEAEQGPHDPKWEGYLITSVKDPVKELAETKDAYVSYLVSAKVCDSCVIDFTTGIHMSRRQIFPYSQLRIHQREGGSRTSSSYGTIWRKTSPPAWCLLSQTSTD